MLLAFVLPALSAPAQPQAAQKQDLDAIQQEITRLESGIRESKAAEATLAQDLQKLEKLLKLQALEIQLSSIELEKLEARVQEMTIRRDSLQESIGKRKKRLRELFSVLPTLESKTPIASLSDDTNTYLSVYRESVSRLLKVDREEILSLKKVLEEVETLNAKLLEDKERLVAHAEDLKEKQAILALNKKLKKDLLTKTRSEQQQKLKAYQAAKAAESELESLLSRFNLASEMKKKNEESQRLAAGTPPPASGTGFAAYKGKLPFPADGKIVSAFGRKYDPSTSLYTFHKGVDIDTGPSAAVKAVFPGKVVYSGELGGYGRLLIIDHGDQYYSLVGQLGDVLKKEGDAVAMGETVARSAADSKPLYFEIRQRHVALNPVPWFLAGAAEAGTPVGAPARSARQ